MLTNPMETFRVFRSTKSFAVLSALANNTTFVCSCSKKGALAPYVTFPSTSKRTASSFRHCYLFNTKLFPVDCHREQIRFTSNEPGYTHFAHARRKTGPKEIFLYVCLTGGFIIVLCMTYKSWTFGYTDIFTTKSATSLVSAVAAKVDAGNRSGGGTNPGNDSNDNEDDDGGQDVSAGADSTTEKKKAPKMTFRDKKIIAYENKLREFSTPEKVFRYFATLKVYLPGEAQYGPHFEVFMTPDDFVRSITPNSKQPEGLGLEQFELFVPSQSQSPSKLQPDSVFYRLGKHGLISYTDYIFLLTLLSTSPRHFSLAFKMFDIDGDGVLDYNEFEMVEGVIRNQTKVGSQHRDHMTTGAVLRRHTNSSLAQHFFGPNLDRKLTIEKFLEFQAQLQRDILRIEFERQAPKDGRITEVNFCKMLLQYSGFPDKTQQHMIKRVRKLYGASKKIREAQGEDSDVSKIRGISMEEVENFFCFLNNISDVDTALTFYRMAGAQIDPRTLQRVARTVARVEIPDHVIEAVFALFDANQDGELSNKEFTSVMKRRRMRGLERSKDTGFTRILTAMWRCSWDMIPVSYYSTKK